MTKLASKILKQPAPQRVGVDLYERLDLSAANVDKARSIIKNVKILGKSSPNKHGMDVEGTDYLPVAHNQARVLYEGKNVNVGHPPRNDPDAERNPNDRNGVLFNVKTIGGETFGDWQLLEDHPLTRRLLQCASDPRLHAQFALSHNAKGYGHVRENRYQVSEIPKVRSVDVVCDGGTNSSLFESRDAPMKKKFKDILESALPTTKSRFKPLLELYEDIGDMPADAPPALGPDVPEPEKPEMDYMGHLGEMVKAILADEGMSVEEKRDKIMAAIKVMEETKAAPPGEGGEGAAADTTEGDDEEKDNADKMEAREREELQQLRGKDKVLDLCESLHFQASRLQVKAMIPFSEAERKAYIAEQKTLRPAAKGGTQPRTSTGRAANVQESIAVATDLSDTSEETRKKRAIAWLS